MLYLYKCVSSSLQPYEVGTIVNPCLQMTKWKLAQNHAIRTQTIWLYNASKSCRTDKKVCRWNETNEEREAVRKTAFSGSQNQQFPKIS